MLSASLPFDEPSRLAALHHLQVLDSVAEPAFDALVQAASASCGVPISLLSLLDAERQWFKAGIGLPGVHETPRNLALCGHTLLENDLLEVPDTALDLRFADNPLVTGPTALRFYAGVPVRLQDGHAVGVLCVIDHVARQLDDVQRLVLRNLAVVAGQLLDGRRALQAERTRADKERDMQQQLKEVLREVADLYENAPCAYYSLDAHGHFIRINQRALDWLGCSREELIGKLSPCDFLSPETQRAFQDFFPVLLQQGRVESIEAEYVSRKGSRRWVSVHASVVRDSQDQVVSTRTALFDITDKKNAERALQQSQSLLERTGELAGIGGWEYDPHTRTLTWSHHSQQLMEAADSEPPLPAVFFKLLMPEARRTLGKALRAALRDGVAFDLELQLHTLRGRRFWARMVGSVEAQEDGQLRLVGALQDITNRHAIEVEARRLSQEMRHRATHDPLTGLVNRAEFELRLNHLLSEVKAGHPDVHSVMFIDLDQFKLVNDTCGHAIGDQLLRQVSHLLKQAIRGHDTLARLGGDEFGVILERCTGDQAARVGRKICDHLEVYRFVHEDHRFRIGTSIGLVEVDASWPSVGLLLQAADSACYRAKDEGRNRVHRLHNSDELIQARQGEIHWVNRLEHAMEEDRFVLFGQRIEGLQRTARGLHCEVLLRLQDDQGGLVPPALFIPAAERYHLAARLDRWVVRRVFAELGDIREYLDQVDMIAINLSGKSVADRAFHRDLIQMVRAARFDVRKLCFEITETAAITNFVDVRPFIEEMRNLGVRIALDDFGAGASSFAYLKSLPVDFLKIDGQFISHLLEDPLDQTAVQCFQQVAQVIGVRTIAEFVEREPVRARLTELGVDFAQGYLVHRPEPLSALLTRSACQLGGHRAATGQDRC